VFQAVNDYLITKLNAQIDFVPIAWGDYDQKMSVVIASKQQFDLCYTANWVNNFVANVSKGAFLPLDDLLQTDAPQTYASMPASFWNAVRIDGKIYGVINQQVFSQVPAIIYPTANATKYNFDPSTYVKGDISTLDPFISQMFADNPNGYVIFDMGAAGITGQDYPAGWNIPGAIDVNDSSLTVFNQWTSPAMLKEYATLQDWNTKGWTQSTKRMTETDDPVTDWASGLVLMKIGGTYKPGGDISDGAAYSVDLSEIPSNNAILTTGGIQATLTAVSATSANPDMAMKVVELMNTDPTLYNLIANGIEGTHYTLNSDGLMVPTDQQANYNPGNAWAVGTNFLSYVSAGMPKDVWDQTKQFNDSATVSPLLGFTFDPTPVKDDIAKCTAIMAQYARGLGLGYYTTDQYNDMVSQLQAAGSDNIIAEMQKQIDAWKTTQTGN